MRTRLRSALFAALAVAAFAPSAGAQEGFVVDQSYGDAHRALGKRTLDDLAVGRTGYMAEDICFDGDALYAIGNAPLYEQTDYAAVFGVAKLPNDQVALVFAGSGAQKREQFEENFLWQFGADCADPWTERFVEGGGRHRVVSIEGARTLSELAEKMSGLR